MFRIFGGDRIRGMMSLFQIEDVPIESGMLVRIAPQATPEAAQSFERNQSFQAEAIDA